MSDSSDRGPAASDAFERATTAGGLLRQARQAQGLHIAALAAAIKVVPRKLELLEADQFDQLPDATFTRALAQTVCRTLKIDAAPVLALLPPVVHAYRLEQVAEGLKTPFHERPGRLVPRDWATVTTPVLWIAGLIVVLTVVVYALPPQWLASLGGMQGLRARGSVGGGAASAVADVLPTAPSVVGEASSAPALGASSAMTEVAAPEPVPSVASKPESNDASEPARAASGPIGALQFRTTGPSWIGVTDAHGKTLIGRLVPAGENLDIDGDPPFKLTVGNAVGTQVFYKGQPVALAARTRDNVARLELK